MKRKPLLDSYRLRRDFHRTPEPAGEAEGGAGQPIFVIQKHAARSLHYDFRLEVEGVLKSWAIPKGPSTNPKDKRLAVLVEDHPLEYGDFEGVIPAGEYGGGTVQVWDRGTYRNLLAEKEPPVSMEEALHKGHLEVWLEGHKLRGGYALIRFRPQENQWLLVKMDDLEASVERNPVRDEPQSVLSGRTLEEIARGRK